MLIRPFLGRMVEFHPHGVYIVVYIVAAIPLQILSTAVFAVLTSWQFFNLVTNFISFRLITFNYLHNEMG